VCRKDREIDRVVFAPGLDFLERTPFRERHPNLQIVANGFRHDLGEVSPGFQSAQTPIHRISRMGKPLPRARLQYVDERDARSPGFRERSRMANQAFGLGGTVQADEQMVWGALL
jgi:hypothetical protein